jgi:3-hydroxyisobutyrate dehydrogenase
MPTPGEVTVGVIGTGHMGGAVAGRVLGAGYRLAVHDTSPAAVAGLAGAGAEVYPDPEALAAACDMVLLSLPSHTEVDRVVFGAGGVLGGLRDGGVLANLTTGSVRHLAALAALEASHDIRVVTCPVSQGVDGAGRGELSMFLGGTAEACEVALPVLKTFASRIIYLGDHAAAMAAKLITNLSWYVNAALLPELLALAVRSGISRDDVQEVLAESCGDSWVIRHDIPSVLDGSYDPSFTLGLACKDLRLIGELITLCDVPAEIAPAAAAVFGRACRVYGAGAPELYPARWVEQLARVQLGPDPPGPLGMVV